MRNEVIQTSLDTEVNCTFAFPFKKGSLVKLTCSEAVVVFPFVRALIWFQGCQTFFFATTDGGE